MTPSTPSTPPESPRRRLRLTSPADLLAFVPYSLGFHPHDSVVLLSIGPGGRTMTARADLTDDPEQARSAAVEVARAVALNDGREVLLVAYTDDPGRALLTTDELVEALDGHGVPVTLALRADGRCWHHLGASDGHGSPYDLGAHPLTAESVLEGRVTYADREQLAASLDPADPTLVDAVLESLDGRAALEEAGRPTLRAEAEWAAGWVRQRVARPVEVPRWPAPDEVARLLRVLEVADARDVVLAEVTRSTARAQVGLWTSLARLAPDGHRAHVSALLALAAWLDGNGALAWCAIDRAREVDPDHPLARIVTDALEGAVPPSTWAPTDPATLRLLSA